LGTGDAVPGGLQTRSAIRLADMIADRRRDCVAVVAAVTGCP
jgi:hypothetical protein